MVTNLGQTTWIVSEQRLAALYRTAMERVGLAVQAWAGDDLVLAGMHVFCRDLQKEQS